MKKSIQVVVKAILAVIALTLINCVLLVLSFCLPTGPMRQNVAESYPLIEAEHPYLQWDQGYTSTMMDFWSEYTEYGMAINEDSQGNAFERAMFMRYIDTEDLARDVSVERYARYPDEYFEQSEYPRYWNGIVIFYKVLLLFFTIPDIRMLNMFLQLGLLAYIIYLMSTNDMSGYLLPFFVAILFINPVTMLMSVKYASEYVPMLLSIIAIIKYGDRIGRVDGGWNIFFAILGSITSFFCMLSFPGIVLGIPMIVLLWRQNGKNATRTVISGSCYWAVAYGITWVMKWIICTLFTSYNLFMDAFERMDMYENVENTGNSGATVIGRLIHNLWAYKTPAFVVLFMVSVLLIIVLAFSRKRAENVYATGIKVGGANDNLLDVIVGYVLVALIPVAIIIGLGNGYAYTHYYMAHRQFAISVLAFLSVVQRLLCGRLGAKKN